MLKQPQYKPMPVEYQVMIIICGNQEISFGCSGRGCTAGLRQPSLRIVDTKYPEIPESIRTEKVLTEDTEKALIQAIEECQKSDK